MPNICDKLIEWDDMDADERLEFLEYFINDYLADEGYGSVNVTRGPSDYKYGSWIKDTNTVNFNDDTLAGASTEEALDTAIHEATHAEKDFEGGHSEEMGEDDNFEKYTTIFEDDGSVTMWPPGAPVSAEHREIYLYAQELTDMIMEACEADEEPESGAERNLPPGDWVLPDVNEENVAYA